MSTFRGEFRGCAIVVETEKVDHPVLRGVFHAVSVVITRDGQDLGYAAPQYESQDEAKMAEQAIANAKIYIKNRFPK